MYLIIREREGEKTISLGRTNNSLFIILFRVIKLYKARSIPDQRKSPAGNWLNGLV